MKSYLFKRKKINLTWIKFAMQINSTRMEDKPADKKS